MGMTVYSDYATKLHSLEEELHGHSVKEELPEQLIHELNSIHEGLNHLATQVNQFAKSFLDELRQKTVVLYGEIDDFCHKHAIEVIRQETETFLMQRTKAQAAVLKEHIEELLDTYRPPLSERRVVVVARLALEDVDVSEEALMEAEVIVEEVAGYLASNDRKGLAFLLRRLSSEQRRVVLTYLDPGLFHDVEGAANEGKIVRLF
jgi:ElaB/YqjD/DUF883 family membrane-anchored ribosome-binding protein